MFLDEMAKQARNLITDICTEQCTLSDQVSMVVSILILLWDFLQLSGYFLFTFFTVFWVNFLFIKPKVIRARFFNTRILSKEEVLFVWWSVLKNLILIWGGYFFLVISCCQNIVPKPSVKQWTRSQKNRLERKENLKGRNQE